MAENSGSLPNSYSHSQHPPFNNTGAHVTSSPNHVIDGGGSGGWSSGARYKLLSPAKLPISRSTCITIPPGLSPTSFPESPVLLSNIKAEPSPTTGSLSNPMFMYGYGENAALSLGKSCTSSSKVDERTSNSFGFKFHSGFSSLTIPAGLKQLGCFDQVGAHSILQFPAPPVLASSDQKDSISITASDRTSDDEYNWRKYGQKLVKGSEFPRSYYKCTYPNCEVKKIFECSPSGQITEIVYKGSHDHPKPFGRRQYPGALTSIQEEKFDKDYSFTGQDEKLNIKRIEPNVSQSLSPRQANEGAQILNINNDDIDEDDPFSKRRKIEDGFEFAPVVKPIREPRVVVQTVSEVDILDDGYRWRKYGQKVVRGNPNPRSYYKCTSPECPVRKHVERASHDAKAVITTYEGKHDHDVPIAKNSNHASSGLVSSHVGNSKITTKEEGGASVSLGLRVSALHAEEEAERRRIGPTYSSRMVIEGLNRFQTEPVRYPSNQCTPNLGRILMRP